MRKFIKGIVERYIQKKSRDAILRFRPIVIGVAGSVGKTSTKEAIFSVVSKAHTARKSTKSYNNEFGVPLTVLGIESGFSSPLKWLHILRHANRVAKGLAGEYPQVLVLEMGSDHAGDIEKLIGLATPSIGVLTGIAPVHLEFFGDFETVKKEESQIIRGLESDARGVINGDDRDIRSAIPETPSNVLTYGLRPGNDIAAGNIQYFKKNKKGETGTLFSLRIKKEIHEVFVSHVISETQVYSLLAAAAVGHLLNIPIDQIVTSFQEFIPPAGRMRLLPGIKKTLLIDDTYNSSPKAVKAALATLRNAPHAKKRIAVLGDMAELGATTLNLHHEVGTFVPGFADILITVGEKSKETARGAREAGMKEEMVFSFDQTEDAGKFLQERMHQGDVILVKGSQAARMEHIVKEVMAEPQKAPALLVRQEAFWS